MGFTDRLQIFNISRSAVGDFPQPHALHLGKPINFLVV